MTKRGRGRKAKGTGFIDLTGVPPQPLILKNQLSATCYKDNSRCRPTKAGSSKYTGTYYDKTWMKWKAVIMVQGKQRSIGYYDKEEDAAADYARAAFKYKEKKQSQETYGGLDLSGVPKDLPLIRSERSATGFKGVKFSTNGRYKGLNRYEARISIGGGKNKTLGTFDTAEEAALIYARAQYYLDRKGETSQDDEKKAAAEPPPKEKSEDTGANHRELDGNLGPDDVYVDEVDEDPVDPCFIEASGDKIDGIAV